MNLIELLLVTIVIFFCLYDLDTKPLFADLAKSKNVPEPHCKNFVVQQNAEYLKTHEQGLNIPFGGTSVKY